MKNKVSTAVVTAGLLAGILGSAFAPAAKGRDTVTTTSPIKPSLTTIDWDGFNNYNDDDASFSAYSGEVFTDVAYDTEDSDYLGYGSDNYDFNFEVFTKVDGDLAEELTTADVKVVSSNSKILVALADNDSDTDECDDDDLQDYFNTTDVQTDLTPDGSSFNVCVKPAAEDTAADGTIKVYAGIPVDGANNATYVLVYTINVTFMGPVATLTQSIADGYKYVANDNDGLEGWLKIVGKDANGTILNDASDTPSDGDALYDDTWDSHDFTEATGNTKAHNNSAVDYFDLNTADSLADINADGDLSDANQYYYLEDNTCNSADTDYYDAGDEGKSLTLKVAYTTDALNLGDGTLRTTVTSNAITITCTLNDGDDKITGISATVTSGTGKNPVDAAGDDLYGAIVATVTDSAGRPMGDGGDAYTWSYDDTAAGWMDVSTDTTPGSPVGGKLELAEFSPSSIPAFKKYTYTFKVNDADRGTVGNQAKSATLSYTAINPTTIKAVLNKAKTSAVVTVNFGADAAGEYAFLVVETATGKQTEYRKMANASGVATWTLNLRKQTVYLSAYSDASDVEESNILAVTYK